MERAEILENMEAILDNKEELEETVSRQKKDISLLKTAVIILLDRTETTARHIINLEFLALIVSGFVTGNIVCSWLFPYRPKKD